MANNFLISYDLRGAGRDYKPVFTAIHSLGTAVHMELSMYYLSSSLDLNAVGKAIWDSMQKQDRLVIADTKANKALMYGLSEPVIDQIKQLWS